MRTKTLRDELLCLAQGLAILEKAVIDEDFDLDLPSQIVQHHLARLGQAGKRWPLLHGQMSVTLPRATRLHHAAYALATCR